MKRKPWLKISLIAGLLALCAGCQSFNAHNPLSKSHGLPQQYEAEGN